MKEKFKKIGTRVTALALASSMFFSLVGCDGKNKNNGDGESERSWVLFQGDDYRVINVSDNNISGMTKFKLKSDKDFVLVVKPVSNTYAKIYESVDYVKKLIEEYGIKAPILYDISDLMSESNLRANVKLAKFFCEKLEANSCYVGLYGSASDMNKFSEKAEELGIDEFLSKVDKLIIDDGNIYDGIHNMNCDYRGRYTWNFNICKTIEDKNLNNPELFIDDFVYIVKQNDNLTRIADKYCIKVDDLADYNNINKNDMLAIGTEIIIPNYYIESNEKFKEYTVKVGDTFTSIAIKFNVSVNELLMINSYTVSSVIYPGDKINIPVNINDIPNVEKLQEKEEIKTKYYSYSVAPEDTLIDIANKFNVSIEELLECNFISDLNKLNIGDVIRIPITNQTYNTIQDFLKENEYMTGIDVSHHQGDVFWKKVKENKGVGFCKIRIKTFENNKIDEQFVANLKSAIKYNIPFGIYYFSTATTRQGLLSEANTILKIYLEKLKEVVKELGITDLESVPFDFPIYIDIEGESALKILNGKNNKAYNDYYQGILDSIKYFEDKGIACGVYANKGQVGERFLNDLVKDEKRIWLVNNDTYDRICEVGNVVQMASLIENRYPDEDFNTIQYTDDAKCSGIGGSVDFDACLSSVPEEIEDEGYNQVKKLIGN